MDTGSCKEALEDGQQEQLDRCKVELQALNWAVLLIRRGGRPEVSLLLA